MHCSLWARDFQFDVTTKGTLASAHVVDEYTHLAALIVLRRARAHNDRWRN
jgi:hypothetical protein